MLTPDDLVFRVIEAQRQQCIALESPEILDAAKNIAFYSAMLDAQQEDPLDDPDDSAQIAEFFKTKITEYVEIYQELVNEQL